MDNKIHFDCEFKKFRFYFIKFNINLTVKKMGNIKLKFRIYLHQDPNIKLILAILIDSTIVFPFIFVLSVVFNSII